MFAYSRAPIDFWPGWLKEDAYLAGLGNVYRAEGEVESAIEHYNRQKARAFFLAGKVGWEGDVREGPFIAGLPTDEPGEDGKVMIAWKQDNNGDTFVVSPLRLNWLENRADGDWIEG